MTAEVNTQATQEIPEIKNKEDNMRKMAKALEEERNARKAMEEKMSQWEQEKVANSRKPYKDDEEDESNEPYIDHKFLNKKLARFEETFEKKVDQLAEQKARSLLEQEKQQSYIKTNPDFHEVLNQDNIEEFAKKHPAIAERMLRMPDGFDRQALLYEQIKALKPQDKPNESVQDKINQNRKSPYYQPSGIATAPYANQGDFSPQGQANAYKKLQELKGKMRLG